MNVGESNCDWSILYVVIIVFVVVIVIAAVVWSVIVFCCCRRNRPRRTSSRSRSGSSASNRHHLLSPKRSGGSHKYALLDDKGGGGGCGNDDDDEDSFIRMTSSTKKANQSSMMISESGDLTSDDEQTVFETTRLTNTSQDSMRTTYSNGGLVHRGGVSNAWKNFFMLIVCPIVLFSSWLEMYPWMRNNKSSSQNEDCCLWWDGWFWRWEWFEVLLEPHVTFYSILEGFGSFLAFFESMNYGRTKLLLETLAGWCYDGWMTKSLWCLYCNDCDLIVARTVVSILILFLLLI